MDGYCRPTDENRCRAIQRHSPKNINFKSARPNHSSSADYSRLLQYVMEFSRPADDEVWLVGWLAGLYPSWNFYIAVYQNLRRLNFYLISVFIFRGDTQQTSPSVLRNFFPSFFYFFLHFHDHIGYEIVVTQSYSNY